jgi:hypothetical protein
MCGVVFLRCDWCSMFSSIGERAFLLRSVAMVLLCKVLVEVPDDFGFVALALLIVLFLCLPEVPAHVTPFSQSVKFCGLIVTLETLLNNLFYSNAAPNLVAILVVVLHGPI